MADTCECSIRRSRQLRLEMARIAPQFEAVIVEANRQRIKALGLVPELYHDAINDLIDASIRAVVVSVPPNPSVHRQLDSGGR